MPLSPLRPVRHRPARKVGDFWDEQAERYTRSSRRGENHHQRTADRLEDRMGGRVLCVGGLWAAADPERVSGRIMVADLSRKMLSHYASLGFPGVQADALHLPLPDDSVDHVVLPLILHHLTGGPGDDAARLADMAVREAVRVTRPGGRVWLKEIVVDAPVYLAERMLSRWTRWMLARFRIPLVIFHTSSFYERSLAAAGCTDIEIWDSGSPGERPTDVIAPVIGLPWLRVPRFLVPVRYVLISASPHPR